jgi:hypothetical protein
MNLRNYGFVFIGSALLAVYTLTEFGFQNLEGRRHAIDKARNTYIKSLTETKAQLAAQLHDLAHDAILVSNLGAKLSYSVSHALETEIHAGTFDFYVIFDEACKPIAKTLSVPVPPGLCQKNTKEGVWRWLTIDNKPLLFLLKTRTDLDKPFSIGGGRYLNETWASSYPTLLSRLRAADLTWDAYVSHPFCKWAKICGEFNASVLTEGLDAQGIEHASLISKSKLFPLFRPWLIGRHPLHNPLALPLLFFIFLMLLCELLQRRFSKTKQEETQQKFMQWCESPLKGRVQTPEFPWLQKAQDTLVSLMVHCANRTTELTQTCHSQQHDLMILKSNLEEKERLLSENIPHNVLSEYIARSGNSVETMVSSFLEGGVDIESILEKGLLPVSRKMMDMLKIWQSGILTRGERPFIRSLYEQESRQGGGETLLFSELNRLFSYAEQMNTAALHALTLMKRVQNEEGEASKILASWSMLAYKLHDSRLRLNKICEASLELLQTQSSQRISFLSNLPSDFTLNLPVPTLLGSLFMLFSAMKEGLRNAENESLVFQMHKRHKLEDFVLAISVTNERGKPILCIPKESILNRVTETLKPWGILCQDIHRPEGGTYVVVRGNVSLSHSMGLDVSHTLKG